MPAFRLGFDIGGTFTDLVLVEEGSGRVTYAKVPSTPAHPELAAFDGIAALLRRAEALPADVRYVVHGTTVSANAVLQRKGARTGLLTTAGFRDVLEIGRLARGHRNESVEDVLYNVRWVKPQPIVPRRLRIEVPERVGADGTVVRPLDEAAALRAIAFLGERRVESIAICLLHSYANPAHERRLGELVRERLPEVFVSLSSEVLPQYREYERFSTTCLNAYVMPPLNRYLSRLEDGLTALGITAPLHVMQATGGVMTAALARVKSVHTALSGFVGGVLGGAFLAQLAGYDDVITLDIGGTSTDISVIQDGEPEITSEGRLAEYPVQIPIVSVQTIGAGGGSLAWRGGDGLLKVGPQSAGADPGPACYGKGGESAALTDANVCLGRLNPGHLLDGAVKLDARLAHAAVRERVAEPLGLGFDEASLGIVAVANANIARHIRAMTVQRGIDPRACALVAYGGAGPLQAVEIAQSLGIGTVLVPPFAGVISALGLLTSDFRQEYSRTWVARLDALDLAATEAAFRELELAARREMAGEADTHARLQRAMAIRYVGQGYEISTPVPDGSLTAETVAATAQAFHARHGQLYRHASPDEPVEVVAVGLTAVVPVTRASLPRAEPRDGAPEPQGMRPVRFAGRPGPIDCPVYRRERLWAGNVLAGPAIVEQLDSTAVLPPDWSARVDPYGTLVITPSGDAR